MDKEQEADPINQLANDLRIAHFHKVGAGLLAEELYNRGWRIPPGLKRISDGEIQKIVGAYYQECRDNGQIVMATECALRAAQAQLDADKKAMGGDTQ